jgi:hypothetical protein
MLGMSHAPLFRRCALATGGGTLLMQRATTRLLQ